MPICGVTWPAKEVLSVSRQTTVLLPVSGTLHSMLKQIQYTEGPVKS